MWRCRVFQQLLCGPHSCYVTTSEKYFAASDVKLCQFQAQLQPGATFSLPPLDHSVPGMQEPCGAPGPLLWSLQRCLCQSLSPSRPSGDGATSQPGQGLSLELELPPPLPCAPWSLWPPRKAGRIGVPCPSREGAAQEAINLPPTRPSPPVLATPPCSSAHLAALSAVGQCWICAQTSWPVLSVPSTIHLTSPLRSTPTRDPAPSSPLPEPV